MPITGNARRGAALVLVMITCVAIAIMCAVAADRVAGMRRLSSVDLARQKAGAAADTIAARIESQLMDCAADYNKLTIAVDTGKDLPNHPWWHLKGCVYKDANGVAHGPGIDGAPPAWFNGCAVRWSVEPVRIYDTAWTGTPSANAHYVVNPPRDPSQALQWSQDATRGPTGAAPGSLNSAVTDFYHFRVVAQAYALSNPDNESGNPWAKPFQAGAFLAGAQSLRVIQIQSLQLFKYALFYAADDPIGDLDLQTGGSIAIKKGSVHSNGAIYIRGGESTGFNTKNWHTMASGDGGVDAVSAGQGIFIGEAAWPVTVTGVAGIYRMGKTANCLAALNHLKFTTSQGQATQFDVTNPMSVPTDRSLFISDDGPAGRSGANPLDLNGDLANSQRHGINGVYFNRANDSRSPAEFQKAFAGAARDANNGGSKVRTLQNIAELGGRPFEPQSVVFTVTGAKNPLYGNPTGNPLSLVSRSSARMDGGTLVQLKPLNYTTAIGSTPGHVSRTRFQRVPVDVTTGAGTRAVTAEEMPLWWDPTFTDKDVTHPSEEMALADQIPAMATVPADAGDDAKYTLGTTRADVEKPAWFDLGGTLHTPPLDAGLLHNDGLLSFPGVSFQLPTDYGGGTWDPGFYGCGFTPREVKGFYLEAALFGDLKVVGNHTKQQQYYLDAINNAIVVQDIARTDLVIRERRWQQRPMTNGLAPTPAMFAKSTLRGETLSADESPAAWNCYWPGDWLPGATQAGNPADYATRNAANSAKVTMGALGVNPIPRPTLSLTPTPQEKLDYVQYLCSQYSVVFCGRNITAPFFGQILSAPNWRDWIITEDEFVDQRESGYMWGMYGKNGDVAGTYVATSDDFFQNMFFNGVMPSTIPGAPAASRNYRQNVLTLHMRAFQEWLRTTPMSMLGYSGNAELARDHFTGVVYCSRARRSDTYHPLFTPELDWPGARDRIACDVESTPSRLVSQTHYRAYWFTDVTSAANPMLKRQTTDDSSARTITYPPVNFPWNWREPSGPLETSRCAVRIRGQTADAAEGDPTYYRVYWNHATRTSTSDALGTSGFTFVTPQRFYMQGNYCYVVSPFNNESQGVANINANLSTITPCAVFADNYTMQSVNWQDVNAQDLPTGSYGCPPVNGGNTSQFTSMVINNSPNSAWNCGSFGSAGQEGTFRMMENWGGTGIHLWWSGSQVVMNIGRYHHSGHNYVGYSRTEGRTKAPAHMGIHAFDACANHYIFNTNLFAKEGRPPLAPNGINATRVVNQLTYFSE